MTLRAHVSGRVGHDQTAMAQQLRRGRGFGGITGAVEAQRPQSAAEERAARVVAAMSDCVCVVLDPGGGGVQLPDYEIQTSRGQRLGVMEVTTTVSPTTAEFVARRVRNPLRDARLRMAWFLVMRNDIVDFRAIGSPIADLLVAVEAFGELPWHFRAVMRTDGSPFSDLYELGVMMTSALPARDAKMAGTIHLKPPAVGGAIGPEMVTQAVQIELDKEDNQAKLATAASAERSELFVWLVDNEASMALTTPLISGGTVGMPVDAPVLPEMVTSVWAATGIYDTGWHARAVWRSDRGLWIVHPPPLSLR